MHWGIHIGQSVFSIRVSSTPSYMALDSNHICIKITLVLYVGNFPLLIFPFFLGVRRYCIGPDPVFIDRLETV